MKDLSEPGGFSLIELLIAVLILAVIAAIAVPSYLEMVRVAQETKVIALLRQWQQAQEQFNGTFGGYTRSYDELEIEGFVGGGSVSISTHNFTISISNSTTDGTGKGKKGKGKGSGGKAPSPFNPRVAWWGTAQPKIATANARYFYTDQTGIVVAKVGGPPTPGDPSSVPLGK